MADSSEKQLSRWVTLVSYDGFEFVVLREAACISGAIRRMLDPKSGFEESVKNRCVFEEISGIVLEKVAEYFYYNYVNRDRDGVKDMHIPPELCLELLMAADYLDT
ncbi:hypothetical protein V499_05026 [Pseudogymnoascus sp. VKM F-103]|uniref:Elongin-C n=1 Tax=Pseudogymnoascus verrucosus TaxID=342668 RepID=A0A1B8GEL0_9PEZI|nr:uncharacterized protein VE01_07843 [Pseudogymnoascus verrucosus]KFY75007.1 hypothetical protein V499_05026 [Pseudogymnoascus sp. VKM F-103]OBT94264.1 hypothetical protein VE01_07843 [Pseudogymnoascus verrucosus]